MAKVVVVGGAGYLGSHTACAYKGAGHDVVVIDDLSTGKAENVKWGGLREASLNDMSAMSALLKSEQPDLVIDCAGSPGRAQDADYSELHRAHIGATLALIEAMIDAGVERIILASSCESYGPPLELPITEKQAQAPNEPYGWSVYVAEKIVQDLAQAHDIRFAILRSFNIVGASEECRYGGDHPCPLNPLPPMLDAALKTTPHYELFGVHHPTRDGTLERELLHVNDVAHANLLAGERLLSDGASLVCNLGRGRGVTLNEMLVMLRRVSGVKINIIESSKTFDKPPRLFADGHLAGAELGWKPKWGVEASIRSAFEARQAGRRSN
jgi:UDP-arabinose 4-epimerase